MPFRYRLQKFLEIRIKKKEEQLQEVVKAQAEVDRILLLIQKNKAKIKQTIADMRKSDPQMYEAFDRYLKSLYDEDERLNEELQKALENLEHQKELLREREKEVNVLEKHKENKREEYIKEEKAAELKLLNEIGSQKHYAKSVEKRQENGD
ncbi:MAG: hypothetical protein E7Z91_00115 [Cyanobacteria bacterium SIG30]|nr:hypothetical protein [Cyanobacteria bacterium SIG30]